MSKERKDIDLKSRLGLFDNSPILTQNGVNNEVTQSTQDPEAKKQVRKSEKSEKIERDEDESDVPKLKAINIKLSPSFHEDYKVHCIKQGQTIQDYTVALIKKDMKKNK